MKKLSALLGAVVIGGVLFIGAVAGWFDNPKMVIDKEYLCGEDCEREFMELSVDEYEELIKEKKSFVVMIDQTGCHTADRLREFMLDYAKEQGFKVYKMMFSDMREVSLHDYVKYYPSVVMVSQGRVIGFLRADSDDDADAYNNYEDFKVWISRF